MKAKKVISSSSEEDFVLTDAENISEKRKKILPTMKKYLSTNKLMIKECAHNSESAYNLGSAHNSGSAHKSGSAYNNSRSAYDVGRTLGKNYNDTTTKMNNNGKNY